MADHGNGSGGNSGPGGGNSGPGGGGGNPGPGGGKVHIIVDNVRKEVRGGDWVVSELKQAVGVDAAKVLAEISPSGINDLDDSAHITVVDNMRFMSHARTGGSS